MIAPESPKYLYSIKKYKESRDAFEKIARYNRVIDYETRFTFDTEELENRRQNEGLRLVSTSWNGRGEMVS